MLPGSATDHCGCYKPRLRIWYGPNPDCHVAGMGLVCVANDSSHGDVQIFSITELEGMGSSGGFSSRYALLAWIGLHSSSPPVGLSDLPWNLIV
jgi:hypothetical protein